MWSSGATWTCTSYRRMTMRMHKKSEWLTVLAIVALGVIVTPVIARTTYDDREVIVEWNAILQAHTPATAGLFGPRYYAMLHVAMFDAVNSIEREFGRFHVQVW